jgi:RNA polymerase sigma-70 factor (ECF subfamily)
VTATAEAEEREVESALIRGVLRGDEGAFRSLYRAHAAALYRLAMRLCAGSDADAQDVVQEGWGRAVRGLDGFEGRSSLGTWLSSIVVRCALEHRRADRHGLALPLNAPGRSERPEARLDLERAFESLPEGFRTVLVLHDLEGYRHSDIAELLGITIGTSKSQLSRARARMREILGVDYVER